MYESIHMKKESTEYFWKKKFKGQKSASMRE